MFHDPILQLAKPSFTAERFARFVAYEASMLGASTAEALVSWHLIEKHCLRLKDRWTRA